MWRSQAEKGKSIEGKLLFSPKAARILAAAVILAVSVPNIISNKSFLKDLKVKESIASENFSL